jgi:arylsulfatase A
LTTICEAAGITLPKDGKIDGHSFLPQLRGGTGTPRSWIYSWYSPRGEQLREFAFNHRYKLYQTGEFFDLSSDPAEKNPQQVASLSGAAAKNAKELQAALDQYKDARPEELPKPGRAEGAKPAKEKKGKRKGK